MRSGLAYPLASLLKQAHPDPQANFVRLSGADGFSRNLPIEKAMHPDSLIAYSMNGEKLTINHGFPLRAVIPGWYGMDSVKWLRSVEVRREDEAERNSARALCQGDSITSHWRSPVRARLAQ